MSHKAKKVINEAIGSCEFCWSGCTEALPCMHHRQPPAAGRRAAASRAAQPSPPALPHVHSQSSALLKSWTKTSSHHLWRREHFLWLISHLLHITLLLLSLYHRLHPPAKGELITCVKLTAGSSLTSTWAGINTNTVFGFCIYCWYGRKLKSNFHSWWGLFNLIFVGSVVIHARNTIVSASRVVAENVLHWTTAFFSKHTFYSFLLSHLHWNPFIFTCRMLSIRVIPIQRTKSLCRE